MTLLNLLFHLMLADFLERVRRPGIWVVAALGVGFGILFLPPADSQTLMLALGPWRGVYNSAWVGIVFGLLAVMILPLFGFSVIKNSLSRDRDTRVGQIIATTPVKRPFYLLGKWLSNLAVLTLLLLVLSGMAVVMQLWRGESTAVQPGQLLLPLWLLGLPVMAILAALALLFETMPLLAGGIGNILFFFGWLGYLGAVALPGLFRAQIGWIVPRPDWLGITRPIAALQTFAATLDTTYNGHFNIAGASYGRLPTIVVWHGFPWTAAIAAERALWLAAAVGLVLLTALVFDRFDPARTALPFLQRRKQGQAPASSETFILEPISSLAQLHSLDDGWQRPSWFTLLRAEMGLLWHGRARWLYALAGLLTLLSLIAPRGDGPPIAALAWLWPVLLWAELGTRSHTFHTKTLIYATPEPRRAQFWLPWLAGIVLGLAATAALSLKALASGDLLQWLGILIGVVFAPSLAIACGVWSGNGRLFQVLYLVWWLAAAVGNSWLDFMAFNPGTAVSGMPLVYLLLALALISLAWLAEKRAE